MEIKSGKRLFWKKDRINKTCLNAQGKTPFLHQQSVEKIEREIAVTDEKIDEIVYRLYKITEEERKIIEEES